MIKPAYLLWCVASLMVLIACKKDERDPCLQPVTTVLRAHTYHHADTGAATPDTLLPNPIFIPLTGGSVLYYYGGQKRISQFGLSLSKAYDSCSWIIRPDSAVTLQDTLTFYYERQLRFLSNSCGYTNYFNLNRVTTTHNGLDSAIINRADVTADVNVLHLKLYY